MEKDQSMCFDYARILSLASFSCIVEEERGEERRGEERRGEERKRKRKRKISVLYINRAFKHSSTSIKYTYCAATAHSNFHRPQ
jgi:hypothetical protein